MCYMPLNERSSVGVNVTPMLGDFRSSCFFNLALEFGPKSSLDVLSKLFYESSKKMQKSEKKHLGHSKISRLIIVYLFGFVKYKIMFGLYSNILKC